MEAQDETYSTILRIQRRLHGKRGTYAEMKGEVIVLSQRSEKALQHTQNSKCNREEESRKGYVLD